MSVLLSDIIAGAKSLADFDEGIEDGTISDTRWAKWTNQSIESFYQKAVVWNPNLFRNTLDYTLVAGQSSIIPPADYRTFRGLSLDPDTSSRRPVPRFTFNERDRLSSLHCLPQGKTIQLSPPELTPAGPARLYYTAGPVNLSTGDAPITQQAADATVKVMMDSTAVNETFNITQTDKTDVNTAYIVAVDHGVRFAGTLPGSGGLGWSRAGTGVGHTMTAQFDGTITIDGLTPALFDRILVFQPNFIGGGPVLTRDYGVYMFTQIYTSPGVRYIATRVTDYDQATEVTFGSTVFVSAGATYGGKRFGLITPDPIVVDSTNLTFIQIDPPRLTIDGVEVSVGDKIFINTGGTHIFDGIWDVSLHYDGLFQYWWLTRSTGQTGGIGHPTGYTVAVTSGAAHGNKIFAADGDVTWGLSSPTWTTIKSALDSLYEPAQEWIEIRTALRALGKGEEGTNDLQVRLAELSAQMLEYYKHQDQGPAPAKVAWDDSPYSARRSLYYGII